MDFFYFWNVFLNPYKIFKVCPFKIQRAQPCECLFVKIKRQIFIAWSTVHSVTQQSSTLPTRIPAPSSSSSCLQVSAAYYMPSFFLLPHLYNSSSLFSLIFSRSFVLLPSSFFTIFLPFTIQDNVSFLLLTKLQRLLQKDTFSKTGLFPLIPCHSIHHPLFIIPPN